MSDPLATIVRDYDLGAHWQDPDFPEQCVCELPWPCDASVLYKVVRELLAKLAAPSPALTREALAAAVCMFHEHHHTRNPLAPIGVTCFNGEAEADAILAALSKTPPPTEEER